MGLSDGHSGLGKQQGVLGSLTGRWQHQVRSVCTQQAGLMLACNATVKAHGLLPWCLSGWSKCSVHWIAAHAQLADH